MDEQLVTVATFNRSFEAQLAKNLLNDEGIASFVSGEITADMLPFGQAGGKDQIVMQVHEDDVQRAAGLLASVQAARLDADWEKEAEAGVWVCSICGEAISNRLSVCYACQTPREGIRTDVPRDRHAIQTANEEIQKCDEFADAPNPAPSLAEPPPAALQEDESDDPPLSPGDDLARHAFGAALFGLLAFVLLPLSWYFLAKLFFSDEDLSPKGRRYVYGALLINGFCLLAASAFYLGLRAHP